MMAKEPNPCPLCGALPCDWVDNPHAAEVGLCWTLARIREAIGVNEKPMLDELPAIVSDMARVLRKIYALTRNGNAQLPQHAMDDLTAVLDRMAP
jgi:hypothetical protein